MTHNNWKKVRSFGNGQDEMPPEGAPAGSLRTIAVDIGPTGLNILTTGTHADRVQFRIIGMGSSGGGTPSSSTSTKSCW